MIRNNIIPYFVHVRRIHNILLQYFTAFPQISETLFEAVVEVSSFKSPKCKKNYLKILGVCSTLRLQLKANVSERSQMSF